MKRYDLRHLKDGFEPRMKEILGEHPQAEVAIFLFEIGDFTPVQKSADLVKEYGYELMNSLKFNEVDWTIVETKEDLGNGCTYEFNKLCRISTKVYECVQLYK